MFDNWGKDRGRSLGGRATEQKGTWSKPRLEKVRESLKREKPTEEEEKIFQELKKWGPMNAGLGVMGLEGGKKTRI